MPIRLTILILLLACGQARGQLATVYVDANNGSDSYSGSSPTYLAPNSGPKATIHAGLETLADRGRLVIFAGMYAGDGIDTDGQPGSGPDDASIDISSTKYPRLVSGLTIELRAQSTNNEIKIFAEENSVRAPNGAVINHTSNQYTPDFIFNIPGGTLTFTTTNGTEFLSLAGRQTSGGRIAGVVVTSGIFNLQKGSSFRILDGATITMRDGGRFQTEAPQKQNNVNLAYEGSGSGSAGVESAYPSFGAGTLTINKNAGTTTSFPSSMSFSGNDDAILINSGNAVFEGEITLGDPGAQSRPAKTADLIITSSGTVTFNAPVTLVVASGSAHDTTISTVYHSGSGTVSFRQPVTWYSSFAAQDALFPSVFSTALIWNTGSGSVTFESGAILSQEKASGLSSVATTVSIENEGSGSLRFLKPVQAPTRPSSNPGGRLMFSVAALNVGGGTLDIAGDLASSVVNATSGVRAGTVNINGPTTLGILGKVSGALTNGAGCTINIGANDLTLSGNANHSVSGSLITSTTGRIVVPASGQVLFDGGNLPGLVIQQPVGGSTVFAGPVSVPSLTVTSGSCSFAASLGVQSAIVLNDGSITMSDISGNEMSAGSYRQSGGICFVGTLRVQGALELNGGSMSMANRAGNEFTASSYRQTGGTFSAAVLKVQGAIDLTNGTMIVADRAGNEFVASTYRQSGGAFVLGGNFGGTLRVLGDFSRTGGSFVAGALSTIVMSGTSQQSLDMGVNGQLASLVVSNIAGPVRLVQPVLLSKDLTIQSGASLDLGTSAIVLSGASSVFANNGSYSAQGSGVILGGATSFPGGATLRASEIRAGAGARFSSLTIDVGAGEVCALKLSGNLTWSGNLSLLSGGLDVASSFDFSPSPSAALVRDIVRSSGVTRSFGSFNAAGNNYTLRLIGNLQNDVTLTSVQMADFSTADSLQIDVGSALGATGPVSNTKFLQFPAEGVTYAGSLYVGPSSAVRLAANGAAGNSLLLSGTNASHRVRGLLTLGDSSDVIVIGGQRATVSGKSLPTDVAQIGNIIIRSPQSCTIRGIAGFRGSFETQAGTSVSLSMGNSPADQAIAGSLVLNGNDFTLDGDITVRGGVQFNAGRLNFNRSNLQLVTSGDFIQKVDSGSYTSTGGFLVMNRAGARLRIGNSEQRGLPNLRLMADAVLDAPGRVTGNLAIGTAESNGIPTLMLGRAGNDLIFTGSSISLLSNGLGNTEAVRSDGTSDGTVGGKLFIVGTSVILLMNGDFSVEEMVYNPPAINGTLSLLSTDSNAHVLTITDMLTHAGGQIGLGSNHIAFAGTGQLAGARAYNRSDGTIGSGGGEFRFVGKEPQSFSCGDGFALPNLRIDNPAGVTKLIGSDPMIITKSLDLWQGVLTFYSGSIVMESGAKVIRRSASGRPSSPLSFRSPVDVSYLVESLDGKIVTGYELPTSPIAVRKLEIRIPSGSPDSTSMILASDATVSEKLLLQRGNFDLENSTLTVGPAGSIEMNGGKILAAGKGRISVTSYSLTYRDGGIVTDKSLEFPSGVGSVARLSILGSDSKNPVAVRLDAKRAVEKLHIDAPGGGIVFGPPGSLVAGNLSISDSLTVLHGSISNVSGTSATVSLVGKARQMLTMPDSGLVFPGGTSPVHLQLDNPSGFSMSRGDLRFGPGSVLFFVNGVLDAGNQVVELSHTLSGKGYDRQGMGPNALSHINGKVRQTLTVGAGSSAAYPAGRYEFPVGTADQYRPFAITFTNSYPVQAPSTVEVSAVDRSPGGEGGLPLDGDLGIRIGSYAPLYWSVQTTQGSFGSDQRYDLDATVRKSLLRFSSVGDLRFIRRPDGNPVTDAWELLGFGLGYGSSTVSVTSAKDTIVTVRAVSIGRSLSGKSAVTIGIPTRGLQFAAFMRDTVIKEGETLVQRYAVNPDEPGRIVRYGLINPPKGAVIDSVSGVFTWTPSPNQAGTYTIVVYATDGQYTVVTSALVVVLHVNQRPVLRSRIPALTSQIPFDKPTLFAVSVSDPDGDAVTISWKVDGALAKSGADTSFTYTVRGPSITRSVRAVFADQFGLSDSTEWAFIVSGVVGAPEYRPEDFVLYQNYPNPFNPSTSITVALPQRSSVIVEVYDLEGRCVRALVDRELDIGVHTFVWDGCDNTGRSVSSGTYVCRMRTGMNVYSRKMVLLR